MDDLLHLTNSLLDDFLYDRLGEEEGRFVLHHLNECSDCRSLLIFSISGAKYLESLFGRHPPIRWDKSTEFLRKWINLQREGWEFPNVVWVAQND